MEVKDPTLSIPLYQESWEINTKTGTWKPSERSMKTIDKSDLKSIQYQGKWTQTKVSDSQSVYQSNAKGASFSVYFKGGRICFYALAGLTCGYAKVVITGKKGKPVLNTLVDLYCNYAETSLKFISPILPSGNYKMTVTVQGMHPVWSDKKKTIFGSTGDFVSLDHVIVASPEELTLKKERI